MNHVSARILFVLQLILFFGGVTGMVVLLHAMPDPAELERFQEIQAAAHGT